MSEIKHTPGPWFISKRYVVGPRDDSDTQSFGMIVGVADVYGDNRDQDARLIAAAPDLLEALKDLKVNCSDLIPAHYMAVINAAIAKAEGSQP